MELKKLTKNNMQCQADKWARKSILRRLMWSKSRMDRAVADLVIFLDMFIVMMAIVVIINRIIEGEWFLFKALIYIVTH